MTIIGTRGITPVRALINEAASMVPGERLALCMVTKSRTQDLHAMTFGDSSAAWAEAADVSAETHIRYLRAPVRRVLSLIPAKYDDMWTGAKGFYKVEPIVADDGQVSPGCAFATRLPTPCTVQRPRGPASGCISARADPGNTSKASPGGSR